MKLATVAILIHSWYPMSCCHDTDCHPVPCDTIAEVEGGYKWQEFFFKSSSAAASQDDKCHVCVYGQNIPMCIFLQQGA